MALGPKLGALALAGGIVIIVYPFYVPDILPEIKTIETAADWEEKYVEVGKNSKEPLIFHLQKGDSVHMSITVRKTTNLPTAHFDIGYWVEGPNGKISDIGVDKEVCEFTTSCSGLSFKSQEEGMYIVWLDNTFSQASFKHVSVAWKVKSESTIIESSPAVYSVMGVFGGALILAGAAGLGGLGTKSARGR